MNPTTKLRKIKPYDFLLFIKAGCWLYYYSVKIALSRQKKIIQMLGVYSPSLPDIAEQSEKFTTMVEQVTNAVRRAGKYFPGHPKCLAQAVVARQLLKHKGIQSILVLAATPDNETGLKAHAWLLFNGQIIIGKKKHQAFTPLAWYL